MSNAGFRAKMRAMVGEAEAELSRLVTYVNDAVVPEVRRNSAAGLRMAAEQMGRLAEHLDRPPARSAAARPGAAASGFAGRPAQGGSF